MCLRPITIKNPNYLGKDKYMNYKNSLAFLHNTTNKYIQVPCGYCSDCCKKKQRELYQRACIDAQTHFVFFQTLTIAPRHMSYLDFADETLQYFDYTYFQKYLKMVRKNDVFGSNFKYISVVEYGGKFHRPHMHVLYFVPKDDPHYDYIAKIKDTDARNYALSNRAYYLHDALLRLWRINNGTTFKPVWDNLCDYKTNSKGERNYDFVAVEDTPQDAKNVCYYVSKYVTKFDDWVYNLKKRLYGKLQNPSVAADIWQIVKPRVTVSKHFGLSNIETYKIINRCITYSLIHQDNKPLDGWKFLVPDSGQVLPLSRYYSTKFLTVPQQIEMWFSSDDPDPFDDLKNIELEKRESREPKFKNLIRIRNGYYDPDYFDESFEFS